MDSQTIILATHETHTLNVLAARLQSAGYRVVTATNGNDALRFARSVQPSLLIADFQLPHLSGLELCARLGQSPRLRDLPVILLTARGFACSPYDRPENIRKIVNKPFAPRELLATVKYVLAQERALVGV